MSPELLQIRDAFRTPLPPVTVTSHYRARLLGVLIGLVALQVLYLSLIVLVVFSSYVVTIAVFNSIIPLNLLTLVVYAGPPVIGTVVTLFLLKPILVRPGAGPERFQLDANREPILFEYVAALCRALGAPRPNRIFVDLQANASAGIRGWKGFFGGHLDLTIGLPLVANLTFPQFSAILAHEFGHFSQRTGMRSYFLIESIRTWFARVVIQRDYMDAWLDRRRSGGDWRIRAVAYIADGAVKLSRRYLTLLMKAGSWVSASFSRQMEFDADRRAAALVGTKVFEETAARLPVIGAAVNSAWQHVGETWPIGQLPEDFVSLASYCADSLPKETTAEVINSDLALRTGRWDTHPCSADRIENIRQTGFCGSLEFDVPRTVIFNDFRGLSVRATAHYYRSVLGVAEGGIRLVPISETVAFSESRRAAADAQLVLFGISAEFCSRWFRLPDRLPELGSDNRDLRGSEIPSIDSYNKAIDVNVLHFAGLVVRGAGVKVNPTSFQLMSAELANIKNEQSISRAALDGLCEELRQWANPIARRMENAIAQLAKGEIAVGGDRTEANPETLLQVWSAYGSLSSYQERYDDLRRLRYAIQIVQQNARLFSAASCANLLDGLRSQLESIMDGIFTEVGEMTIPVAFDPNRPLTIKGQFHFPDQSSLERANLFLSRMDRLLSDLLAKLSWTTVNLHP